MAKRLAIAAVCLPIIAVSVYTMVRPARRLPEVKPEDYRRPWVCEACGHAFLELPATGTRRCPECGKDEAVQSLVYICGACGHEFEAYRLKDYYSSEDTADAGGQPPLPVAYYKKAGGEWTTDFTKVSPIRCPKCGNADPATFQRKTHGFPKPQ